MIFLVSLLDVLIRPTSAAMGAWRFDPWFLGKKPSKGSLLTLQILENS
jgi:hypothetical protein